MTKKINQYPSRLNFLISQGHQHLICDGLKGIEKESLRISNQGSIAQTQHPYNLGSALTHPNITTDYSESLLEFITPPFNHSTDALDYLEKIHQFTYQQLDNEMLLAASMPCGINGDESIPIAEYGSSNIGTMKHIYREGLWHRYGRTMQAIAGIHFNYSVPESVWPLLAQHENAQADINAYIAESYFGLIRNFQRQGWLILYLFGASPAICKNFFKSRPHLMAEFDEFDKHTLFHPYATSLRMSDIGYKSKNQQSLKINYNTLAEYVDSLSLAVETPYADYEKIGVKVNGHYKQLNTNILQIENEFYNTIRPKQLARSGEKPTVALNLRGVRYIEVRSLDLDLFNPIGIDIDKACFIEAFLLHCLFQDSPKYQSDELKINNDNQLKVAHEGRKPGLMIQKNSEQIELKVWAEQILENMVPICQILDQSNPQAPYSKALEKQLSAVENPNLTPSAKILQGMNSQQQPFGSFGLSISEQHQQYFRQSQIDPEFNKQYQSLAQSSHQKQRELENSDELNFDEFLKRYFSQNSKLGLPRIKPDSNDMFIQQTESQAEL